MEQRKVSNRKFAEKQQADKEAGIKKGQKKTDGTVKNRRRGKGTGKAGQGQNKSYLNYKLDDNTAIGENESRIEGRNAVTEAFRSGRTVDRLYVLDGCQDGSVNTIKREAAKAGTPIKYVSRERLDQMSETGSHQGVIALLRTRPLYFSIRKSVAAVSPPRLNSIS